MSDARERKRKRGEKTSIFNLREVDVQRAPSGRAVLNRISDDGRRMFRTEQRLRVPNVKKTPSINELLDEQLAWNPSPPELGELDDLEAPHEDPPESAETEKGAKQGPKTFATLTHDQVLLDWAATHRDLFVDELLRLDGFRGGDRQRCSRCPRDADASRLPTIRCLDCTTGDVVCRQCCLAAHADNPFHRIAEWNGKFFAVTTLQQLGLVIQLGHPPGEHCAIPAAAPRSFVVIHTNGFHPVNVQFCQCDKQYRAGTRVQQLLRRELWPATLDDPSTCCTFRVLEMFHMLTLQSKVTAYDFYLTLQKTTDRFNIGKPVDRLKPFLRTVRQWRHAQALKRAGRGHKEGGVKATKPGELCIRCPACPRPGVNLPPNWDTVSDNLKFIYTTFVAIDANFRLKRRTISNETHDPSMSSGWGHFVEGGPYREHLKNYVSQEDISTCTGFAALMHANTRFHKGYATTGVAMAIDARHGFMLPNGVGDLQKGERNCNIDYITMCALLHIPPPSELPLVLSYDIMCQWIRWLLQRIAALPSHLQIELPAGEVRYAIPKYHLNGHKEEGHNQYSLNFMFGVGRTDGEEVERGWSRFDATAASTREMGPGSREETLEDHFMFNNQEKYINLAFVRFDRAHTDLVLELQPAHVAEWNAEIIAYEADPSRPDPYFVKASGMSEAEIRLQLAKEEEEASAGTLTLHEVTPTSMIATLLDLEEQQRKFRTKYPCTAGGTPAQTAEAIAKRAALRHRLNSVRAVQAVYMPCVARKLAQYRLDLLPTRLASAPRPLPAEIDLLDVPERQPLFLPHQLEEDELQASVAGLADLEARLRDGQLSDSLDKLRVHLHIRSRLIRFKDRHICHQRANTRARTKIDQNEVKIAALKEKYRAARKAKLALVGPGSWERRWRVLLDSDVTSLRGDDEVVGVGTSEGKRTLSWIWMGADAEGGDANGIRGLNDALHVEYFKSRARRERYREETILLQEEKRRTLASLEHAALEWDCLEGQVRSLKPDEVVGEGAAAYAASRAAIERALRARFHTIWTTISPQARALLAVDSNATDGLENDEVADLHFAAAADADSDDDPLRDLEDSEEEE
ncbi:CxC2 domain-containing protein [Phanerochaete sordida]|uniref:CxC2 domain-containing protein n=1 Tax=Phanerochaete sordida TaxID=48140 RepID=A0A9P3GAS9_9APHY|nr:CxC2 domain-containing protein [Phanerochaete sordida]